MRDMLKDKKYFDEFITEEYKRVEKFTLKLEKGEVKKDRILPVKIKIHDLKLGIFIAKYSRGDELFPLKKEFIGLYDEWENVFQSEYYNKNLIMISLAALFNLDEERIRLSLKLLQDIGVKDWVFEFILNTMLGLSTDKEVQLMLPDDYKTLKEAVYASDPVPLLRKYLLEEWYDEDCGCYEMHKSKQKLYYGYWSFEVGAFVKILQLEDEGLKKMPYYPYDLIHYIECKS